MISKSAIQKNLLKLRLLANKTAGVSKRNFGSDGGAIEDQAKVVGRNLSDNVFEFTLNNPRVLNSLDMEMIELLGKQLKEWKHGAKQPKVVLMKGAGDKAFCAGGDIKSVYNGGIHGENPNVPKEFFAKEYIVDYALAKMDPVQIAVWNGIVMGGGVGVSVHAPIRIATEKTMFAMPETGIGFFTDVGGSYFLSRLKDNVSLGLYLGVTGHRLKAKDCLKWGVATHYMHTEKLTELYADLMNSVNESSGYDQVKEIVDHHSNNEIDGEPIPEETINYCFKPDCIHDIKTRLAEVADGDTQGFDQELANKVMSRITSYSPVSCAVVVEQIKRGQKMNLEEVFKMEYKISQGFMELGEFYEGVRALLIDRDNKPQWKHKVIDDVTHEDLKIFFDRNEKLDLNLDNLKIDLSQS